MRRYSVILAFCLAAATPSTTAAATWHLEPDGTGDFPTLWDAVDASADGDSILLGPGLYPRPIASSFYLSEKAVTITSVAGPEATVLDFRGYGGIEIARAEASGTLIEGVTLRNGGDQGRPPATAGLIVCQDASLTVRNVWFESNRAGGYGGAIFSIRSSIAVEGCRFKGNHVGGVGGALAIFDEGVDGPTVVTDCLFEDNEADDWGGALDCEFGADPVLRRNTFVGNRAPEGSAVCSVNAGTRPLIESCILAFSSGGPALFCRQGAEPTIRCSDVFGNAGGDSLCGIDGGDNLEVDPQFCGEPGSGNFYLQDDSPCSRAASPCGERMGALPVACGTVSIQETTWGRIRARFGGGRP
jgi:hypothetical protein